MVYFFTGPPTTPKTMFVCLLHPSVLDEQNKKRSIVCWFGVLIEKRPIIPTSVFRKKKGTQKINIMFFLCPPPHRNIVCGLCMYLFYFKTKRNNVLGVLLAKEVNRVFYKIQIRSHKMNLNQ